MYEDGAYTRPADRRGSDERLTFSELLDLASERLGGARALRERRLLRREGEPSQAAKAVVEGARVHRPRQVDGRLGEPPQARRPATTARIVRLGLPRRRARRRRRHGVLPRQLSRVALLDRRLTSTRADAPRRAAPRPRSGVEILPQVGAAGRQREHLRDRRRRTRFTHVRLHIYPDGGVARLARARRGRAGLAALAGGLATRSISRRREHGGARARRAATCSSARSTTSSCPGRARNMGDGWETKRRRGPGHDWVIVRLARGGTVRAHRDRHEPLQGQLSRHLLDRRQQAMATTWTRAPAAHEAAGPHAASLHRRAGDATVRVRTCA